MMRKLENTENASLGIYNFFKIFLYYLITDCSCILIRNMLGNNMYYFDKVTFTRNVMRKKVCVDFSLFSVISYRAIASEVIQIGQNKLHNSILITELSEMSNLHTFGAQLSDFWPSAAKIGKSTKMRVWAFKIFLRFSYII